MDEDETESYIYEDRIEDAWLSQIHGTLSRGIFLVHGFKILDSEVI